MKFDRDFRRKLLSAAVSVAALACVGIALYPLADILYTCIVNGLPAITSPGFFTLNPPLPCNNVGGQSCSQGGIYPMLQGTALLVGLSAAIALPIGILAGIYLSEYGHNRFGDAARFAADVLAGVPSIVFGIIVFSVFFELDQAGVIRAYYVLSVLSASVALALIMLPIVARTAEEALRLVPTTTREAALALGLPRYRVVLRIVLSTSRSAVITGSLLAVARAMGETAPLIILDPGNIFPMVWDPSHPTLILHSVSGSLPLGIYNDIQSAYPNWIADAWGMALVLILIMLSISIAARLALRNKFSVVMR
jgi:phosphate transport system permease protein